jgi:hypothetical protein
MGKVRATVARGVRTFNLERAKRTTLTVAARQIWAECLVSCATRTFVLSASGVPIYARLSGGSSLRKWSHMMHEPGATTVSSERHLAFWNCESSWALTITKL